MKRLYTYGYQQGTLNDLLGYAAAGAVVADIRLAPWSQRHEFRLENLRKSLGESYVHLPELGNLNYQMPSKGIQLNKPTAGFAKLHDLLQTRDVVLLCVCQDPFTCHRTQVLRGAADLHWDTERHHLKPGERLERQPAPDPNAPPAVGRIPAITLWQPWASLMAVGAKKIETRSWATPHRGWLAIHAAKKWDEELERVARQPHVLEALARHKAPYLMNQLRLQELLPLGAVVAIGRLGGCVKTEVIRQQWSPPGGEIQPQWSQEYGFGDYSDGRFGWVFDEVRPLATPIPAQGLQKIWNWTPLDGWEFPAPAVAVAGVGQ